MSFGRGRFDRQAFGRNNSVTPVTDIGVVFALTGPTLSIGGEVNRTSSLPLTSSIQVSLSATVIRDGTLLLQGDGDLLLQGQRNGLSSLPLSGAGVLAIDATFRHINKFNFALTGSTCSINGTRVTQGTLSLQGDSSFIAKNFRSVHAKINLATEGYLGILGNTRAVSSEHFTGTGLLNIRGVAGLQSGLHLTPTSDLDIIPLRRVRGALTLSGDSELKTTGLKIKPGYLDLPSTSTLTLVGKGTFQNGLHAHGYGDLFLRPLQTLFGDFEPFWGQGTLVIEGVRKVLGELNLVQEGTLTIIPSHFISSLLHLTGKGSLTITGKVLWGTVSLNLSGEGTLDLLMVKPTAKFIAFPPAGMVPLGVNFTNYTSGGGHITYAWDFGDGGTSNAVSPYHLYQNEGLYSVTLTATNESGYSSYTLPSGVSAVNHAPVADFVVDQTYGLTRSWTCYFTDTSINFPFTWSWDFGDGGTSTEQNPLHLYLYGGIFNVTLRVTNPCGVGVETKYSYIQVIDVPPKANFSADPTSGNPLSFLATFSDLSSGYPSIRVWDFGHTSCVGGESSRTAGKHEEHNVYDGGEHPTHIYDRYAGEYNVTLTVYNTAGSNTITKRQYIKMVDVLPTVDFSVNIAVPRTISNSYMIYPKVLGDTTDCPGSFYFYWTQTGYPSKLEWDFGDGKNAITSPDPCYYDRDSGTENWHLITHTFTYPGDYDVVCKAINTAGSAVATHRVHILWVAPIAEFTADTFQAPYTHLFHFTDTSARIPVSWSWDFGDGGTSTEQNPTHTYPHLNTTYTVKLTVTNPKGSSSVTHNVKIGLDDILPITYDVIAPPLTGRYVYDQFSSTWQVYY